MKPGLLVPALVVLIALVTASSAHAAEPTPPTLVSPNDGASFTARTGQITFTVNAPTNQTVFIRVSASTATNSDGVIGLDQGQSSASERGGTPGTYDGSPDASAPFQKAPGTYYWQAFYIDCSGTGDCYIESPVRSLTIQPLPAPTSLSPPSGVSVPYGYSLTLTVHDPSYTHDGTTTLYIEFATGNRLDSDGTFADADSYFRGQPLSAGSDSYEFNFGPPFTQLPRVYYWMAERYDCEAEPDCWVTNGDIRSFTVLPQEGAPNTLFTRHPRHRTHRHHVRFAFDSNDPHASFQCRYAHGWRGCSSPQVFRHLRHGRYVFKVRARDHGKTDQSPASWSFRVLR